MRPPFLRTWIEIDTKALLHNYHVFRRLTGQKKLLAVVKSNAYGHNIIEASKVFAKAGADYLGVDSMTEALTLRREGIKKPILVLGYTLPEYLLAASQKKIILSLSSFDQISALKTFAKNHSRQQLSLHLKIDTGMHRQGFQLREFPVLIKELKNLPSTIKIEGLYSHMAAPAEKKFQAKTKKQIAIFQVAKNLLAEVGYKNLIRHLGATGGTFNYPDLPVEMVRIGIGLYGYYPSDEVAETSLKHKNLRLQPALVWKTIVSEIKEVAKNESVSYSFTKKLKRDSRLAILPIGYWHGYPRALSSLGQVMIKNQRAKVIGRVCMDMIIIDITDHRQVKVGDEVTLLGDKISAEEFATWAKTSNYEVITRLNPLIKKIYR
ncbi:MAG: alanine racemase [Candidatus Vogelbacteria bacterium RIFOXYD2_FULL_44_9]|uniref:Alanine racemase n=1 Tax=Candidatus Vogelbacteria bacterium RIFOXYD2_FULL_44_9 TaxID=1802441 RepID=A0A1G2QNL5_9BACT|nr:MAG: alanine racemase [Candidatus Vogelbacteria bacterium RIFOXYD2_FULL_44_9]